MTWPQKISGNRFSVCQLDPDTPMELRVVTWSNVFESGGNIAIEGYDNDGGRHSTAFERIRVASGGSAEREHLQALVDDFNADLETNWRAMVLDARTWILDYERKKLAEAAEAVSKYENGVWS